MPKKEATPFVIDFKQPGNNSNYGTTSATAATHTSGNNNNNDAIEARTPTTVYCLHGHHNVEVRDHCHRQRSEGVDVKARRKLIIASALCLFFMICEIVGGVLSNSLAIATDAAHLLTDFASFMISLFAIWIAGRPSTQRMSFGWYRAEVIGAMASVVMIWVITGILVYLAVQRVISQEFEVDAVIMLVTSGLAILVNLIMGFQLHHGHSHSGGATSGHSHDTASKKKNSTLNGLSLTKRKKHQENGATECGSDTICPTPPTQRLEDGVDTAAVDAEMPASGLATFSYQNSRSISEVHSEISAVMAETAPGAHHHGGAAGHDAVNMNVRAAFIHVVGDIVQSVGVFLAALLIYFKPEWQIADPICTFVFSIIVLYTTIAIMKDALLVLMEGSPSYMHYNEVLDVFKQIDGVKKVHNLRIWALSINKIALSAHLAVAKDVDPKRILDEATRAVHMRYNFFETTIQIEEFTPQMEDCQQCAVPDE